MLGLFRVNTVWHNLSHVNIKLRNYKQRRHFSACIMHMSKRKTKPIIRFVRPADRSAWASAQNFFKRTAKTDQTGRMPRLIRVFSRRTCSFVGFVVYWLISVYAASGTAFFAPYAT